MYLPWQVFLLKFAGIAAATAKIFSGFSAAEAFYNGGCPGRSQNKAKIFPEDISQVNDPVAVQTAGDDGAIAEDAEMIL